MLAKLIIAVLLIAIVVSLFSALFFMLKDSSKSKRTVRALTLRVGLQVALIVFLLIAATMGWIHPHGLITKDEAAPGTATTQPAPKRQSTRTLVRVRVLRVI